MCDLFYDCIEFKARQRTTLIVIARGDGHLERKTMLTVSLSRLASFSMSDPGTTYRQREEVQKMRSTQDPIMGLKKSMIEVCLLFLAVCAAVAKYGTDDLA